MPALVEATALRKSYISGRRFLRGHPASTVQAVADVSLSIQRGEAVALVGESGCGKSTTVRLLLRLEEPSSGTVRFNGRELGSLGRAELRAFRRQAQIIFQDPYGSLNPRLTVGAALREVLTVHQIARGPAAGRRAAELLELVGLDADAGRRFPHEFSGGQRQRIGIARALGVGPEFLLADEPVSALDVSVRAQVLNLFKDLQERLGLTYLVVAHDLAAVRQIADRVAVMYLGRIVEVGPAESLYRQPLHPYTRALLDAVPRPRPGRRGGLPLHGEADPPATAGCPFYGRCNHPARDGACLHSVPSLEEKTPGRFARCIKVETG